MFVREALRVALPPAPSPTVAHSSLPCNPSSQTELPDDCEQLEENLLSVRKTSVGRTHSLPNDSYMFLPVQIPGTSAVSHTLASRRAQSGSAARFHSVLFV